MAGKGVHCAFFFFFSILFLILLAIFLFPCWMRGRGKCKGGVVEGGGVGDGD